jgi:hypothetical protein
MNDLRARSQGRPYRLALCDCPGPAAHAAHASDVYASTPDGGYPGTPAAIAYRHERDTAYAAAVAQLIGIYALVNGVVR